MPDAGEKVKTPDGMALVVETNLLENKVKTRIILEEANKEKNQPEKLSTEFYTYAKEEIKRINKNKKKKKNDNDLADIDGELLEEIKDLLKD